MWSINLLEDPLQLNQHDLRTYPLLIETRIVCAQWTRIDQLFHVTDQASAFCEGGRVACVALADFVARKLEHACYQNGHPATIGNDSFSSYSLRFEPLSHTTIQLIQKRRRHYSKRRTAYTDVTPFVLERTDVAVDANGVLTVFLRCFVCSSTVASNNNVTVCPDGDEDYRKQAIKSEACALLYRLLDFSSNPTDTGVKDLLRHVATTCLQDKLRQMLHQHSAVAFVANGSILPRESGVSTAPMASPPAIPFSAPIDSLALHHSLSVELGLLYQYIEPSLSSTNDKKKSNKDELNTEASLATTTMTLIGLLIPRGVSLIVGGGYHGKSTLLRCLAAGVYNKIPGDGREFCVTVDDAVTVRAEDGRYVHHCNVSAFISNLPTPTIDTKRFSSGEASGSTSQAANVSEAIEMGASAFLVDEDTSAANFMARDGRMRSLVMDESITPLLYRVNGLYAAKGISSIVVVGGVGDWLDVPQHVILMDRYICKDATAKARSVSMQFSHGHVQYAGRGVVHRLDWERSGTPIPRRPAVVDKEIYDFSLEHTSVALLEGSRTISLQRIPSCSNGGDSEDAMSFESNLEEEEMYMDLSRCEQLLGNKPQLYGCGLCVAFTLQAAKKYPELGLPDLLRKMDEFLDTHGLMGLMLGIRSDASPSGYIASAGLTPSLNVLIETLGCAYRPRRFEVGQALTRLRGIIMEEIPFEEDESESAAEAEKECKKQELLALWNARRTNPLERMNEIASRSEPR